MCIFFIFQNKIIFIKAFFYKQTVYWSVWLNEICLLWFCIKVKLLLTFKLNDVISDRAVSSEFNILDIKLSTVPIKNLDDTIWKWKTALYTTT